MELYLGEFEEARSIEDCKDCQHFYFCYPDDMNYEDLTKPNLEMCIRKKSRKNEELISPPPPPP